MLTYNELLQQVEHLSSQEQLALVEDIIKILRSESGSSEITKSSNPNDSKQLRPISEIQGSLNPTGKVYTDEEIDDLKYSYLSEKLSY